MDPLHPFYQKLQNSKNILLVKDDVGKAKQSVRELPNSNYSYGSKFKKDYEGAGAIISSWQVHNPTTHIETEKDFRKLNRMSLNQKQITPKQVSEFVKQNDIKVKEKRYKKNTTEGYRSFSGEYFGLRNKPSTPMDMVVCYGYGNDAAEEKRKAYEEKLNVNNKPISRPRAVKNSEKIESPVSKKDFKMKKFQMVGSKIAKGCN